MCETTVIFVLITLEIERKRKMTQVQVIRCQSVETWNEQIHKLIRKQNVSWNEQIHKLIRKQNVSYSINKNIESTKSHVRYILKIRVIMLVKY